MLQPVVRRTWAPRGATPILTSWDRHDRLSVIGALRVSPTRYRLGLYWTVQAANVCGLDVVAFLRHLHRAVGRPLLAIIDRLNAHRTAARLLGATAAPDGPYRIGWLPPYAPELDPVEYVWSHTTHDDLANYVPDDLRILAHQVDTSLGCTSIDPARVRGCFRHARLVL